MSVRILIVDDQPSVRNSLRSLLASRADWEVCGEAADGLEGIEKAKTLHPDLVLMDISMPRLNGLEATRILRREVPESKVVIVSQNDPAVVSLQAWEVNAAAHVAKQEIFATLLPVLDGLLSLADPEAAPAPVASALDSPLPEWLTGSGSLGELIGRHDWSKTTLGAIGDWPQSLKTSINLMLSSQHPMWIGWGPQATFLYNQAYIQVLGHAKHPWALGRPAAEVWSEIWDICGPLADKVFQHGEASFVDDVRLFMNRGDFFEETYYSFSYSPIRDESGRVSGLFCPSTEVTAKVINARRLHTLSELSANALVEKTTGGACASVVDTLANNLDDVPFAILYLTDGDSQRLRLEQLTGIDPQFADLAPPVVDLAPGAEQASVWPLADVVRTNQSQAVPVAQVEGLPTGPDEQRLSQAIVLPILARAEDPTLGVLIAGVNPTRRLDPDYLTFYSLLVNQVASAIQNARAAEEERKRLEALAELDRAKTTFFSNVSHEFRTPLTLMLGPVEELLSKSATDLSPSAKSQLELVNRNGTRLLRLVNTLLDFSRIEAGRIQAIYQPTDLAAFTAELASVFDSATGRAGLKLNIDCPKLSEPVFVDRSMWEKIVLNLVSNAFKFTFEGQISVSLRQVNREAQLHIRDTGVGIPEQELSRVFERFHRIDNTRSRTHEGSGIGLALVQELVKLHSGSISVESVLGEGTTFIVSLPFGKAHLSPERIGPARSLKSTTLGATPFVEEALRWLPDGTFPDSSDELPLGHELMSIPPVSPNVDAEIRPFILVADDNADMRQYLYRILSGRYEVQSVADGEAALAAIRKRPPELVLTDVMMPRLDGFGVLRELRSDPRTRTLPVILLSARAGEEAQVDGIEQGADDYLIKPFSARELLARVQTHIQMARLRNLSKEGLVQKQQELNVALAASDTGTFRWDPHSGEFLALDANLRRLFGFGPEDPLRNTTDVLSRVHPSDLAAVTAAVDACAQGADFDLEFRVVLPDGQIRWLYDRAQGLRDEQGNLTYVVGACTDVTRRKQSELDALAANAKFRAVFEQTTVFSGVLNTDGVVIDLNHLFLEGCGYHAEEAMDKLFWQTPWWRGSTEVQAKIQRACLQVREGIRYHEELPYHWADGSQHLMQFALHPIYDHEGRVIFLHPSAVDITELKQTEENYRTLADNMSQFAWISDHTGWISWYNQRWFDYTGGTLSDMQGWGWRNVLHPDHADKVIDKFKNCITAGVIWEDTFRLRSKEGEYRWFLSRAVPIQDSAGKITRWFGTNTDITDLRHAQDALRESKEFTEAQVRVRTHQLELRTAEVIKQSEQLSELSQRMLQIQEDERRHVARELHDSAGQTLTALGMSLGHLTQLVREGDPQLISHLEETQQFVRQLSQEIRTMSYLLHPPLLDENGLPVALRWYVQGLVERSGLTINVDIPEDLGRFPHEMELMIFRLVQECLTNIHRHSGSKTAEIRIWRAADNVILEVQDEGKGIPADRLAEIQAHGAGVGIRGMRERIRRFEGQMEISSDESGTTISFKFPVPPHSRSQARNSSGLQVPA